MVSLIGCAEEDTGIRGSNMVKRKMPYFARSLNACDVTIE